MSDEKSCENCYWNDDEGKYAACIVSRGRTGKELCVNLGGKADRWCAWPGGREAMKCPKCGQEMLVLNPSGDWFKCMACGHEEKAKT